MVITGKVQGVYYRAWTTDTASSLGLSGWVRNLNNGDVEAIFNGTEDKVTQMIKLCWSGSSSSKVENISVYDYSEAPLEGFIQKPTVY